MTRLDLVKGNINIHILLLITILGWQTVLMVQLNGISMPP